MTNGAPSETNGIPSLMPCPCCGSSATVEPHLIEAGCTVGDQTWTDWWTASVNCTSCPLQFIAGGDTEDEAVRNALAGWNTRAAVTDHDFSRAVHDGNLWGKCSECKERQGYYLDAETIQRQQEHIAELTVERGAYFEMVKRVQADCDARDELIRDMFALVREEYPPHCYRDIGERMQALGLVGRWDE